MPWQDLLDYYNHSDLWRTQSCCMQGESVKYREHYNFLMLWPLMPET